MPTLVQEFTEAAAGGVLSARRAARAAGLPLLTWAMTARNRDV